MTRFRRMLLGGTLLLLALVARARANLDEIISTEVGSGVSIKIAGPINVAPSTGCLPCWLTIRNDSGAAHTWTVRCQEQTMSTGHDDDGAALSQSLEVANHATARLPLLVPVLLAQTNLFHRQTVVFRVEGYGVEERPVYVGGGTIGGSFPSETAFIGLGETLATPIWATLTKQFAGRGTALSGAPVDTTQFGPDWRELSGFDCLWLTDEEYTRLDAGQRTAIREWVEQGGNFILSARQPDPALRASLGLPAAVNETNDQAHLGFGHVEWISWDGAAPTGAVELAAVAETIKGVRSPHFDVGASDADTWKMTKSVGTIPLNTAFLIGFIGLFAVVAGPINLFLLAPAARRHRLFWTTPLISCAASALLIVVILLRDGFGGHGERVLVARLFPGQKQAVLVQEQVARTGVLLSRRFTVAEDVVLTPLRTPTAGGRSYEQSGRTYGGDWFTSRSVQAQRAEAIVPSRAEVQLLDSRTADAPPVVVSSIPATLREIHYLDPARRSWHGRNLRTGERMTLQPDASAAVAPVATGSSYLLRLQKENGNEPGTFFALADDGPFIETLSAIQWRKQEAVYLGPVTPPR